MLTERQKSVLKRAKKDILFLSDIRLADGDTVPGMFSDDTDKFIFISAYYGWCVGKYGPAFWDTLFNTTKDT